MKPDPRESSNEQRVDAILAEYMVRVDRGERIDPEEFIRQHSEVAEELRAYFLASQALGQAIDFPPANSNSCMPGPQNPRILEGPAPRANTSSSVDPAATAGLDAAKDPANSRATGLFKVPGYEIVREIGRGGMGVVYEALQKGTNRRVALKVVAHGAQVPPGAAQLFLRETSVLSQLRHKRIVEFYEVGMAAGRIFLAMEYVEAVDVRAYLAQRPTGVEHFMSCGIICQVLDALMHTHGKGLVHRDIKPHNVLVSRHGRKLRTKLADFGLAKHFESAGFSDMTAEGETRGTLTYMAPEQFANSRYAKPSCDIYAAGATLYYYLAGESPYQFGTARSTYEVSRILLEQPPVPLRDRRPDVPQELADVIHKALRKDAASRFASAAQMYAALYPFAKRTTT